MRASGIDIGSRTVKLAIWEDGEIILSRKAVSSHDPFNTANQLIHGMDLGTVTATGYGRHLAKSKLGCPVISEIKAFALGARWFSKDCITILDIGGQDTKAIALDEQGNLHKFEMNDKCAAGTGRFLEIMATALGFTLDEFVKSAVSAKRATARAPSLPNPKSSRYSTRARHAKKWLWESIKPSSTARHRCSNGWCFRGNCCLPAASPSTTAYASCLPRPWAGRFSSQPTRKSSAPSGRPSTPRRMRKKAAATQFLTMRNQDECHCRTTYSGRIHRRTCL